MTKLYHSVLAAALAAAPALGAERAQVPNVQVPAALHTALAAGRFTATIAPRQGYVGARLVGQVPAGAARAPGRVPGRKDFFPADLGYYGGAVVTTASHINVYWGEPDSSTWGYPDSYEAYLNASTMIHLLDPYVGATSGGRYPVAGLYWSGGSPGTFIWQSQIVAEVQAIAAADVASYGQPGGYNNIIHVFLPPGTDTCFDNAAAGCYNPDGAAPGPFTFCAYHSSTTVNGQEVLYTVEPYQSVGGCSTGYGTPNDTANVLGHEVAETITDPDPGNGWVGEYAFNRGSEIGDECAWQIYAHNLAGAVYDTQDWYKNATHACGDR